MRTIGSLVPNFYPLNLEHSETLHSPKAPPRLWTLHKQVPFLLRSCFGGFSPLARPW